MAFSPWVGPDYQGPGLGGVRVLILGESHYGEVGTEDPEFTIRVVTDMAIETGYAFFTKAQNLVEDRPGARLSRDDRCRFWGQVAFYNYIQTFVGPRPRIPPTQFMWERAEEPFVSVLEELEPQVVVALGYRLSSHVEGSVPATIRFVKCMHPSSSRFRYSPWTADLRSALESAREP